MENTKCVNCRWGRKKEIPMGKSSKVLMIDCQVYSKEYWPMTAGCSNWKERSSDQKD